MIRRSLLLASISALVAACSATRSSSTADSSSGGDSSSSTVSASSASSAASSSSAGGGTPNGCNGLANMAPEFQPADVVEAAPVPMGGTIENGTYFLSAETHYAQATVGPDGPKRKTMLVVSGKTWQLVSTAAGQLDYQATELVDPKGIELGDQRTCPDSGVVLGDQYTATPKTLVVYQLFSGKVLIGQTFDKQP